MKKDKLGLIFAMLIWGSMGIFVRYMILLLVKLLYQEL